MIPVNQVILGGGDPLLGTTTIGTTIEDQLQFLEKQKQLLENARQRQLQQLPQPAQPQVQQKLIWDEIDNEIEPMTDEQKNMLFKDEDYVETYNKLQSMVQAEILSLVKARIENTQEGKELLSNQLKIVKKLKGKIIDTTNREIDNKIIESAINFWFKDDDYKGGSKVWKYFMNM